MFLTIVGVVDVESRTVCWLYTSMQGEVSYYQKCTVVLTKIKTLHSYTVNSVD